MSRARSPKQKKTGPLEWLRHAFAVDRPGAAEPDPSERAIVERLSAEVVRRRLATPALLMLEMYRPFNYLSAQALHFFEPIVSAIADTEGYRVFARFLEQRGSIDYLAARIEALEAARTSQGKTGLRPAPDPDSGNSEKHA